MVSAARLTVAAGAAAAGWYWWLLRARENALATYAYDQAFFQQLVWRLGHGYGFTSSFGDGSFLGLHFEPLLAVVALPERVWPDAGLLSLLCVLAIGALGPSAFLFLRALTDRAGVSAALAAPVPFWPALQEFARADFHPEIFGVVFALLAGWAGLTHRRAACWTLAALALTAKEDQVWNVLVIGLVLASRPASRRLGAQLIGMAVAWGVAVTAVVMPLLRAGRHVDTDTYYQWLTGATPAAVLHALASPSGWFAFGILLVAAAGLPLLRPLWLLPALPPLVADLLSAHDPQPLLHLQYGLPLVLPVLVAAGFGAAAIPSLRVDAMVAVPAVLAAVVVGTMPPALGANPAPFLAAPAVSRLLACTASIPTGAPIAADDPLLVPLASRPVLHELTAAAPTDYLLIDREARLPGYVSRPARDAIAEGGTRVIICDDGRFRVLGPE